MTVSALNRVVAGSLLRSFPLVRVAGEVGNFTRAASGHWYFVLKDAAAQVRCVMFRGRNVLVSAPPRDGESVEVLAQVTLYEPRGEFQLGVESLQRGGLGRLYEEFVRLRERLAAAGMFDAASKRDLPRFPRAVGVVTSLQAAALRDVLVALQRRAPYLRVLVYPTPVQGEGSGARVAAALATASARGEVDALLLVRGGGSLEDLWAFNEEIVARAIRASRIPVVCGVGHESDITIADLAADVRAPTPTAAAELVAPSAAELATRVSDQVRRLTRHLRGHLDRQQQRLDYAQRATALPGNWLAATLMRVDAYAARLDSTLSQAALRAQARLAGLRHRRAGFEYVLGRWQSDLRVKDLGLQRTAAQIVVRRREQVAALARSLEHLGPTRVLQRGYAIVFDAAGRAVTDAASTARGAQLEVHLARGVLAVRVERTQDRVRDKDSSPHD